MDLNIRVIPRMWEREHHLRHIKEGTWGVMLDADKKPLVGIEGMKGVSGTKKDGSRIGADFIRMQPGAKFEPHIHEGDHEIYFISGAGFVHINGEDVVVTAGHLIHIPGEYTHGVWVGPDATEPLIFTAIGHPHKHVHARDRMQHPTDHEH